MVETKCIICLREIHRRSQKGLKHKRWEKCVTCCSKCSATYERVSKRSYQKGYEAGYKKGLKNG